MAKVLIITFVVFLAGCQTDKAVHPTDLMMSQTDLVQQEAELTPFFDSRPHCGAHREVEELLEHKYKEEPLLIGGYLDGSIMQLYVGPSGVWSLSREVGSITCILAAGYGLQMVNPPVEPILHGKGI